MIAIGVPCPQLGERVGIIVSLREAHHGKVTEEELLENAKPKYVCSSYFAESLTDEDDESDWRIPLGLLSS